MNFDRFDLIYANNRIITLREANTELTLLTQELNSLIDFVFIPYNITDLRLQDIISHWSDINILLRYNFEPDKTHFLEHVTRFHFDLLHHYLLKSKQAFEIKGTNKFWKQLHARSLQLTLCAQSFFFTATYIEKQLTIQQNQDLNRLAKDSRNHTPELVGQWDLLD